MKTVSEHVDEIVDLWEQGQSITDELECHENHRQIHHKMLEAVQCISAKLDKMERHAKKRDSRLDKLEAAQRKHEERLDQMDRDQEAKDWQAMGDDL